MAKCSETGQPNVRQSYKEGGVWGTQPLVFVHPISPSFVDSSKHCLKFYIQLPSFLHNIVIDQGVWLWKAQ